MNATSKAMLNAKRARSGHSGKRPSPKGSQFSKGFKGRGLAYEGTEQNRQNDDWVIGYMDPATLTSTFLALLQQRSRSLARTSPTFISAVNQIVDMVVDPIEGVRVRPKAYTDAAGDKLNDDFIASARNLWMRQVECFDIDERESSGSLYGLGIREWVEAGECFFVESIETSQSGDRPIPVTWKIVPAERCDHNYERKYTHSKDGKPQNRITNGIEFDSHDRRVAYYFSKLDDNGQMTLEYERIEASKVRHLFIRMRAGQERGLPWLYGATLLCHDLEDLIGDELTSAHVASMLTAFITQPTAGDPFEGTTVERDATTGKPVIRLQAGAIIPLQPGQEVKMADPNRPGGTFVPFAAFIIRCIAKTVGISYERLSGDYSNVNFASGRLAHLAERETVRRIQAALIQLVARPIWRSFIKHAIAIGKLPATPLQFVEDQHRWTKANFIGKGFEFHDPLKEGTAALINCGGCISTLEIECATRNLDWEEVIEQRGKEIRKMIDEGIPVMTFGGGQVVTGQGDGSNPGFNTDPMPGQPDAGDPRPSDRKKTPNTARYVTVDMNALIRLMEMNQEPHTNGVVRNAA